MSKEYRATVITPYHNTNMELFMRTYHSLLNQSVGFENIEWIIIFHNCKQSYIDAVKELLKGHTNVVMHELRNEARTASSPRNFALQFVTSPYIMFLDSDDTYYPRTIEVCLGQMEKHSPQIVIFRMAYLKQNESVKAVLTDTSLWNPLEEEVVLTGDRIRCEELYSTIQFSGSNKMFTRDLIMGHQIKFDEKINMAEDAYFVLLCYSKSEKIVVLPQFVGHCYFLNSASTVQSMDKPRAEVLNFSYGFKLMFDLLIEQKAYYNHFILVILQAYIIYAYASRDFSLEDWKTLQNDMRPYAQLLTPPPVNKHFTKEQGELLYKFVTHNILDDKKEIDADTLNYYNGERVLDEVIRCNMTTDFGKYYGFESVSSIEEYRKKVPLYDHKSYDRLIDIQTSVGEKNVFSTHPIVAYAYDFNESNEMQTIPVADDVYNEMGSLFKSAIADEVTFLMMESLPKGRTLNDDTYNDSVTGILTHSALGEYTLSAMDVPGEFTSPFSLIFPQKVLDTEYLDLLYALRNSGVTQIYASNTWIVCGYIERLLSDVDKLCDDIENGTVSVVDVDSRVFAGKNPELCIPDKQRALEIRIAVKNNSADRMLKAIWPRLTRIIARNGGMYQLYTDQVNRYLGDITLLNGDFITPFGILAKQEAGGNCYRLVTDIAFYEFVPMSYSEKEETVLLGDIKCGEIYEIIVTNNYGIYRMRTNIFIKPIEVDKERVLFEECERPIRSGTGMICRSENIYRALRDRFGDELYDYYCFYDMESEKIIIPVELNGRTEFVNDPKVGESPCELRIEHEKKVSAEIRIIEKETRLFRRDMMRKKYNAPADCFPPIRNLESSKTLDMIKNWQHIG